MSLEIRPEWWYVGMWFFELPLRLCEGAPGGNYMAAIWREGPEGSRWKLKFRYRYYQGENWEKPFNHPSEPDKTMDRFSWWVGELPAMPAEEVAKIFGKALAEIAKIADGAVVDFLELGCDGEAAAEKMRLANNGWLHCRKSPQMSGAD